MWMSKRPVVLAAIASLVFIAPGGGTRAQDPLPTVTVEEGATLVTGSDGVSTLSATVTVTGSDGPYALSIVVAGADPGACVPIAQPVLISGVEASVEMKLASTCELADRADVQFVTYPLGSTEPLVSGPRTAFTVDLDDPSPPWWLLVVGFGGGVAVAAVATWIAWWLGADFTLRPLTREKWRLHLDQELPGLDGKWTFASSQLTNVTAASAVFTGVFAATPVLEKILGSSADGPIAFAVVASAVSALLVGVAPLWLEITRNEPAAYATPDAPNNFRGWGVLVAAATVEAASVGLIISIAAMMWTGSDISHWVIVPVAAFAGVFVLVYGARAMRRSLKIGMVQPSALDEAISTVKRQAAVAYAEVRRARSSDSDGHWDAASTSLGEVSSLLNAIKAGIDETSETFVEAAKTQTDAAMGKVERRALDARDAVKQAMDDVDEAAAAVARPPVRLPDRVTTDTAWIVPIVREQTREAALP